MKRIISILLCTIFLLTSIVSVTADSDNESVVAETNNSDEEVAAISGLSKGMEVTYNYPIFSDPMQMSDEELFGEWNATDETWAIEPKFAYSLFSGMSEVEDAVKTGDYVTAKDELLEYYREYGKSANIYNYPGRDAYLRSMAHARNFYAVNYESNKIQGFFEVDNTMKEIVIDVGTAISNSAGTDKYRAFILASIDQESTAEFVTKEGGYQSKLTVVVNGTTREYLPVADTYISAGANQATNYGAEALMLASEGITSQYVNSTEDTKRCLLNFNISDLESTDTINSATLTVKGRNASGTGVKEMMIYQWADSTFSEDTVVWGTFAEHYMFSCNGMDCWDYVTSNNTQIKGKICFYHRGDELNQPARMYAYTDDEAYAYTFIRQQMGLINSIGYDPNVMNELDMSTHLSTVAVSIMYTLDSEYMNGERFATMFKHMWTIARWICEDYYGSRDNNYATFATGAGYTFISYFPEVTDYAQWLTNTQNENERVQGNFLRDDGTCIELARHYQNTLLGTLLTPLQRQRSVGNSDSPFTDYVIESVQSLIYDFVYSAAPGWRGFGFGDDNEPLAERTSTYKNFYDYLFNDDPLLEYIITDGQSGILPEKTSMSFPNGLRTYLRSGWDDKADALAITAKGEINSSHGDSDLLSISMFGHGEWLLVDAGYGSTLTGGVYIMMGSAQQHNTVTVNGLDHVNDGAGHAATEGREEELELNNIFDFVTYSADDALSTADKFRRSVAFMRDAGFWVVSDYIHQDGTEYNDYSQHWQMMPSANIEIDEDTKIAYSNFDGVNVLVVPVAPEDYTYVQLEETTYSPSAGTYIDNKKAAYHQKTNAEEIVYTTILVPENMDEDLEVSTQRLDTGLASTEANCAQITVNDKESGTTKMFYYYHLNDNEKQQTVTVGKYKTDATTLIIEEDANGNPKSAMLLNATFLESEDVPSGYVYKSEEKIDAIAFTANGQCIDIEGTDVTADVVNKTTFYDFERFNNVYVDGLTIYPSVSNGYMHFTEEPIVGINPDEEGSGSGGSGGGSVGGSGSGGGGGSASGNIGHAGGNATIIAPVQPAEPENNTVVTDSLLSELSGHWAEDELTDLCERGIITGDGTSLRLSDNVTRAEFVTLLARVLKLDTSIDFDSLYKDVNETHWHSAYIIAASKAGLVNGADSLFRPNDTITREEMCKIIVSAHDYVSDTQAEGHSNFDDVNEISSWALPYVHRATALGLVNGMGNNRFEPKGNTIREQAFVVVSRLLEKIPDEL